jgi:hypothetical protein
MNTFPWGVAVMLSLLLGALMYIIVVQILMADD